MKWIVAEKPESNPLTDQPWPWSINPETGEQWPVEGEDGTRYLSEEEMQFRPLSHLVWGHSTSIVEGSGGAYLCGFEHSPIEYSGLANPLSPERQWSTPVRPSRSRNCTPWA